MHEANLKVQERFNRDVSATIQMVIRGDEVWEGDEDDATLPRAIACFKAAHERKGWENHWKLTSWKYVAAAVCLEQLSEYDGGRLRPL